ncbi:hypothetical protein [Winogradskyella sp. 3972H.M.0a.05]|uniref:hypothetical protein n=1 Tax=Winogradskyella sp. 3972H.M.0a.05 TaxID=2950277 RepID=UPI00339B73E8
MIINKVIKTFLVALSVLFIFFQITEFEYYADISRTALFVLLTILFLKEKDCNCRFFLFFLVAFTLAQVIGLLSWYIVIDYETTVDYFYYLSNGLYILSYVSLILQVISSMNVREVMSRFFIHIFILIVLDIFCVSIVTGTTQGVLNYTEYTIEFIYNTVIMVLLSVALINFMYRDDKKAMNMLVASIFIVFSEIIQLAYFYIAEYKELNVICSVFLVLAFVFFYLQARLQHEEQIDFFEEHLKA